MKIQNFSGDSDRDTINNAISQALTLHKVPESQHKEAKDWFYIRQEVSKIMSVRATGRATPIMNRGFKPPREIIKLAFTNDTAPQLYHSKLRTSKQKFAVLSKAFIRRDISVDVFTDYAKAIDIKEKQINTVINNSLKTLFGG